LATSFPTGLDALTNPTSGNTLASPDHAGQHADANDAIEALEAKVGVNGSAVTSSLDYMVAASKVVTDKIDPASASTNQVLKFDGTKFVPATGASVTVADTPPTSPTPQAGDQWYESDSGRQLIYYDGFWVEIGSTATTNVNASDLSGTVLASNVVSSALIPVGVINPYAGSTAPTGWLLCSNQPVSRETYSALFAVIGTTYGSGDGSTTFNVPDLRGRTVAGLDNMGGTDAGRLSTANTLGTSTGVETVTLTSAQSGVPAHGHANTASFSGSFSGSAGTTGNDSPDHTHNTTWDGAGVGAGGISLWGLQGNTNNKASSGASARHAHSFTPAGSISGSVTMNNVNNAVADAASAHTNMQPTMVLNYIIKAL
jgi:microcystin-dependent protein